MISNKVRKWIRNIHRDLGYLCFGLTVIYAISGVAVNHIEDWNPNYRIRKIEKKVNPVVLGDGVSDETVLKILDALGEPTEYKSYFRSDPNTLKIFVGSNTIQVDLQNGRVIHELVSTRPLLYEVNFLHLNHAKRWWTWFADLYAVALFTLAITGIFILKGRKGITGRGAWMSLLGILIPLFFLWIYR